MTMDETGGGGPDGALTPYPVVPAPVPEEVGAPLLVPPTPPQVVVNVTASIAPAGFVVTPGQAPGAGSVLLNVMWLVLSGFWLSIAYLIAGLIQCMTIIGIPFGVQCFKLAGFAFWPFGRAVVRRHGASQSLSVIGNVVWFLFAGLWLALMHAFVGAILCLTVIGVPLGLANFKMIPLVVTPFGKDIVKKGQVVGLSTASYVAF